MGGFKGAVEVGAHALETDIHLSADGVAVLSHVSLSAAAHEGSFRCRQRETWIVG